jgi:hypothetical protein
MGTAIEDLVHFKAAIGVWRHVPQVRHGRR